MKPNTFVIFLGDDKTLYMKAINASCTNTDPLDLTDCTEIVVRLPYADGSIKELKLSEEEVEIQLPVVLGKFFADIESDVSELLNPGELQDVDVTFTIASKEFTVRFPQALSVFERD